MLKRVIFSLLGAVLLLVGVAAIPAQATYGNSKPCVTQREYQVANARIKNGWPTPAAIRSIFDTNGTAILDYTDDYDFGTYEDVWVEDWWYDDWSGQWVDYGYYETEWVEDVVWNGRDQIRAYPKCASWGAGKVGVWYDNYSSGYSGLRAWTSVSSNPSQLKSAFWAWWEEVPWPGTMFRAQGQDAPIDPDAPRRVTPKSKG
jgi:hypothetical protein